MAIQRVDVVNCILMGPSGTGKTALLSHCACDCHDSQEKLNVLSPTVGVDFCCVYLEHAGGHRPSKIRIWDTGGDQRYQSMVEAYIRQSDMAVVVYDLNNPYSLSEVEMYIDACRQVSPNMFICLLGNKCDLPYRVDMAVFARVAARCDAYFECSASIDSSFGLRDVLEHTVLRLVGILDKSEIHKRRYEVIVHDNQDVFDTGDESSWCCFLECCVPHR